VRQRLHHRVAGAELRLLDGERDVGGLEHVGHCRAAMAVNHAQRVGRQTARRVDDMGQQRFAGQWMQDLG